MEITKFEVEKILRTLPIGYYIKRDVKVTLSDGNASYYDSMNDDITISYEMIKRVMDKLPETEDLENSIRCLLYHETSHAFLTPKDLKMTTIINVFEDERIESILRTYYKDVDFRTFVKRVNNFKNEPPKSAFDLYYQIVRYRLGPVRFLNDVHAIITRFQSIESNWSYKDAIEDLYNDIEKYWNEFVAKHTIEDMNSDELTNALKNNEIDVTINEQFKDIDDEETRNNIDEQLKNIQDNIKNIEKFESEYAERAINNVVNKYSSTDVLNDVFTILAQYRHTTKTNGSAINAYSGIFNPRSVVRDDYKYFVQQNRLGHVKAFSKLHLNLFIDCSGSFYRSDDTINQILYALTKFEKQNKDFTFDMIACGMGQKLLPKNERIQNSRGGNRLDNSIFDLFKQQQFVDCQNVNIVCFDGYAFSDFWNKAEEYAAYKNMTAFDTNTTTIISDYSNECALKTCKNAKIVMTNNYADNLYKYIMLTLKQFAK